jgi:micrococcal nuclease
MKSPLLPLGLCFLLTFGSLASPERVRAQEVEFVFDGDSFRADMGVLTQSVRMVGIECPEGTASSKARREAKRLGMSMSEYLKYGDQAAALTRKLLPKNGKFRIEYDVEKRDKYGRLLGYVFVPDGRMVNEELVKAGLATLFPTEKNVKYKKRLVAALTEAKRNKRGIWERLPVRSVN